MLLNIRSEKEDLYLLHTINSRWVDTHAQLMSMPIRVFYIRGDDEKREVAEIISKVARETNARYLVSGVIASSFQKRILDSIASINGLEHLSPLWGSDQERLLREEVVKERIEFIIVAAQAMGLTEGWVGRVISSERDVEELIRLSRRYGFSPVGEGGEYESYVISSPLFKGKRIRVDGVKKWYKAGWGYFYIERAEII